MDKKTRLLEFAIVGFVGAIVLRWSAHWLAWPRQWSYSGDRADTVWAVREAALIDISYFVAAPSIILLVLVAVHWLFSKRE